MKKWYQSKTVWAGILEIVIGALQLIADFLEAGVYDSAAIALLVAGVLQIVLRFLSDTKVTL